MSAVRPLWDITGVTVMGDHQLRLLFEDGTVGDVSFSDHHWTGIFEPLKDPARFSKVSIKWGTLYWPHEQLDWAPEPLYEAAKANALAPVKSVA